MTRSELNALKPGDIVRHKESGEAVTVSGTKANSRISVRTSAIADPKAWDHLERKASTARAR